MLAAQLHQRGVAVTVIERALGVDDGTPTRTPFGVDNTARSFHSPQEHAFGADDGPRISPPFPILFSEWVTSAAPYWSTLAKRPSTGDKLRIHLETAA